DDGLSIDDFSLTAFLQAVAAALNWSGASGNWDTGFGGTVANGATLSFSGAGGSATNNLSSPQIVSMTFSNGAGSYTLSGNAFAITNGIVNNSTNAQTFSNAITLGAAQTDQRLEEPPPEPTAEATANAAETIEAERRSRNIRRGAEGRRIRRRTATA
ncbi:MAG: hypothetical protein EBV77_04105, partial [Gemmatimonadaceae bacterium]|nr:hypothetical protein [Gemmatimonadaceae bacterium]